MKLGLVCPYNIFKGGGVQECVLAMKDELARRGHDVYIITPSPREVPANYDDKILLIGTSTDIRSPLHTTSQVSVSVSIVALRRVLDKHQFDILHFHEPWVPILSRQILTLSKTKNVATFHAKLPDTLISRTIEKVITPYTRTILKYLDSLTSVSDAGAMYVRSLTDEPVEIIPNGINISLYSHKPNINIHKNILYLGRLEKRKGVKFLIMAYAELVKTNPDVALIIAGSGPDLEKLKLLARSLKLDNIEFLGYVTPEKKLKLLEDATVFCSPALYGESFGIVLLEAMACGIPIVAGNNPGYSTVMKDKGLLSLVNPKDTDEFNRRLKVMLFDEDIRNLWINWATEYVKQFSYSSVIDKYEDLYKRLVD